MNRVVVTGIGVVSPLGNNKDEVTRSLYDTKSGISFDESYQKMGFRSQVSGQIKINLEDKAVIASKRADNVQSSSSPPPANILFCFPSWISS